MRFGRRIKALRKAKKLGQRALAEAVGVSFTYISKIENEKLDFGDYPSEELILKLGKALDTDPDELLLLAKKVPPVIKRRVLEHPDDFLRIARLDDKAFDRMVQTIKPQ